jgi:hypothetical protein
LSIIYFKTKTKSQIKPHHLALILQKTGFDVQIPFSGAARTMQNGNQNVLESTAYSMSFFNMN